jgi:hypothetical protein
MKPAPPVIRTFLFIARQDSTLLPTSQLGEPTRIFCLSHACALPGPKSVSKPHWSTARKLLWRVAMETKPSRNGSAKKREGRFLSAHGIGDGGQMVCRAGAGRRLRFYQLHPGVHRLGALLAKTFCGALIADHRRRHQITSRSCDHPSRVDESVRGAGGPPGSDLSTQLWRQH